MDEIEKKIRQQLLAIPRPPLYDYDRCPRCGQYWHGLPQLHCPGALPVPAEPTRIWLHTRILELVRWRMRAVADPKYFAGHK